jgi:hypothetical protein
MPIQFEHHAQTHAHWLLVLNDQYPFAANLNPGRLDTIGLWLFELL